MGSVCSVMITGLKKAIKRIEFYLVKQTKL